MANTTSRVPHFSLLRSGGAEPPLFLLPGLAGGRDGLVPLATALDCGHPVYLGRPAAAPSYGAQDFVRLEDSAAMYLQALRRVQRSGPYALIGYSMGGLIALEIARQLQDRGETTALLVMIETYPQPRHWPLRIRARVLARTAARHMAVLARLPVRRLVPYLVLRGRNVLARLRGSPPVGEAMSPVASHERDAEYRAYYAYRPIAYSGRVRFIRSEIHDDFPDDPVAVWGRLIDRLSVDTAPGDHLGIVHRHFASVAHLLGTYVTETFGAA